MKTIWFGWLIIGKLLIPPKRGTSNHIFVSFVSKEIKFLSWHRACAVLLAAFGTLHLFAAVSCPLWHLTLPHLSCQAVTPWDMRFGSSLSESQLFTEAVLPAAHINPKWHWPNQHTVQPWKSQEDAQQLRVCSSLQEGLPKLGIPPFTLMQLCSFKQRLDLQILKGMSVTASHVKKQRDERITFVSMKSRKQSHWHKKNFSSSQPLKSSNKRDLLVLHCAMTGSSSLYPLN